MSWLEDALDGSARLSVIDETRRGALVEQIQADTENRLLFVRVRHEALDGATRLIEDIAAARPGLPIIAIGDSDDGPVVLASIRAGADDFLVRGRDDSRLPGVVARRVKPTEQMSHPTAEASPRGAPMALLLASNVTADVVFFSAHVAMAMAGTLGRRDHNSRRVLLVDASLPGGTLPILFGQAPDFYLEDALAEVARCDETLIESAFAKLNDGVFYLCHPEGRAASEIIELLSRLPVLMDQLEPFFDEVVVVGEAGMDSVSLRAMLNRARRAYLCLDTSVAHVRQGAALVARLQPEDGEPSALSLVVTRQVDSGGLNATRLGELLALPVAADLSDRLVERQKAMDEGHALRSCSASAPFLGAARALAADISGRSDSHVSDMREGGRLQRAWQALRGTP